MNSSTRILIKQEFFTFIYGEHFMPYVYGSNATKVMKEHFPDIVKWINWYKNRYGYQKPAQRMQQEESNIIINDVCVSLCKKQLFFTQVYDSIMCLPDDAKKVKQIMEEAFKQKGLRVTIKVELTD